MAVSTTVVILPIPRNWASLREKVPLYDTKNQFILVNFLAEVWIEIMYVVFFVVWSWLCVCVCVRASVAS